MQLVQFANLFKDGKKVKMSTRSGDFYSLKDLIQDIGTDAARFYYLSKQADQHLDFDLNLATSDSKENMFYYIQYAHARIFSLLGKYKNSGGTQRVPPLFCRTLLLPKQRMRCVIFFRRLKVLFKPFGNL